MAAAAGDGCGDDNDAVEAALEDWMRLDWEPWSKKELLQLHARGKFPSLLPNTWNTPLARCSSLKVESSQGSST